MVAVYARQSIDKKESISIETQIEFCRQRIEDGRNIKVYSDKATARNTNVAVSADDAGHRVRAHRQGGRL